MGKLSAVRLLVLRLSTAKMPPLETRNGDVAFPVPITILVNLTKSQNKAGLVRVVVVLL